MTLQQTLDLLRGVRTGQFEDSPYRAEWFAADESVNIDRWEITTYHKSGYNEDWESRLYRFLNPSLFKNETK